MLSVPLRMSAARSCRAAHRRIHMVKQHISSEDSVVFRTEGSLRSFILNRPKKLNALDKQMIDLIRPRVLEWETASLAKVIVASGEGRAFCAGGDVGAAIKHIAKEETRHLATSYFKDEFELDYLLATLRKPYIAICDGHTMGGGYGLIAHAPFRIATERSLFAMPETKIGYAPDVGASFFLSRLDGQIGTYLALTGNSVEGRDAYDCGLATHFVPSGRIPDLLTYISALDDPSPEAINRVIEESTERRPEDSRPVPLRGEVRAALDETFSLSSVKDIIRRLDSLSQQGGEVGLWANQTFETLKARSPTSLAVALELVRRGRTLSLAEAFDMEYRMAVAYCNGASQDFVTGVTSVLIEKNKSRPAWSPGSIEEVLEKDIVTKFFSDIDSSVPSLELDPSRKIGAHINFGLPSEDQIRRYVVGLDKDNSVSAVTYEDIVRKFEEDYAGKDGLSEKLSDVVTRKCEMVQDPGNFETLRWK